MADLYVGIDGKLTYGQTIMTWCLTPQIEEITAVDGVNAKNPVLKTIMAMGVPSTYKIHITTTEEAREILEKPGNGNQLMIVKQPEALTALKEEIAGAKVIMLGNLVKKEDSRRKLDGATGVFYLSDWDVEILDGFTVGGLDIFLHQSPTSARTT